MVTWLVIEATLAFIVFCANSIGEERPLPQRLVRAVLWMVTVVRWFTHRIVTKLSRLGALVWSW